MTAPGVLALHGAGMAPALWDPVRLACQDLVFTVPDLNALSRRTGPDAVALVDAILEASPPGPLVVAGTSLGSRLALDVARRRRGEVVGVLLVSPGPRTAVPAWASRFQAFRDAVVATPLDGFRHTAATLMVNPAGPRGAAAVAAAVAMLDAEAFEASKILLDLAVGLSAPEAVLGGVSAPIAVVIGGADPSLEAGEAETWRGAPGVEGPTIVAEVAHLAPLEAPEVVAEALVALAAGPSGSRRA